MQDKKKHNIDELFRKGMTQLPEEKPSISGWDNLKKEMGKEGLKMEAGTKGINFFQLSVFSGIALGIGALAYYYFTDHTDLKNKSAAITNETAVVEMKEKEETQTENITEEVAVSNENKIEKNNAKTMENNTVDIASTNNVETGTKEKDALDNKNVSALNTENEKAETKKTRVNTNTVNKNTFAANSIIKKEKNTGKADIKYSDSFIVSTDTTVSPQIYRVQVGAYKGRVNDSTFSGIKNLKSEYSPSEGLTRFFSGVEYTNKADAKIALEKIRKDGFEDAFINAVRITEKKETANNITLTAPTDKKEETKVEEKTVIATKVDSIVKMPTDSVRAEIAKVKRIATDSTTTLAKVDSVKKNDIPEPPKEEPKKFCVGVYASLDRNNYSVKSGNTLLTGGISSFGDSINGIPTWGQYTFGVTGGYKPSKRILVETGLFYSQKKKIIYDSQTYDVISNDGLNVSQNKFRYNHNAKFLQLFLKMKVYVLEKDMFRLFVAPGFIFESNLPTSKKNKSYYMYESSTTNSYTKEKYAFSTSSIGSNLTISTGVEFKLNGNWVLAVEPSYNYKLSQEIRFMSSTEVSPVKHYNRALCFGLRLLKEF